MNSKNFVNPRGSGCTINVHVSPGARRTEIVGSDPWRATLHVRLAAEPREGKANGELLRFLEGKLSLPKNSAKILKGEKTAQKIVELPIRPEKAERLLRGN